MQAFAEYGIKVTLDGQPIAGPTFIRFPLQLGQGARISALPKRAREIQVRLALDAPPFVGIVGAHVVVDLQRPDRQVVTIHQVESQFPRCEAGQACSQIPIGVDLDGQLQFADFSKTEHAHLLVAGTTGSGKSEWLRTAVAGLLMTNTPQTLRLLLIDPKRNAFHALRKSPYLWRPIVYPDKQAVSVVLKELADEMDERYRQLDGADTFHQHVNRQGITLPRIVCVCDEYADLVARGTKERKALEEQIFRLGAKARAAGIHLVLATQQPSRQIIKGALDTNMPARVALKTSKAIESKMLLETDGAEKLLGHGDLLFKDFGEPRRLQAVYIPPDDRERLFRGCGM
jgi:DNA segregation ATPase FtsK/SpoIIIE-like protein